MASQLIDDEIEDPDDDDDDQDDEDSHKIGHLPTRRRSNCPDNDSGHSYVEDKIAASFGHTEYVCEYCHKCNWSKSELELIADMILRNDSNAELCRACETEEPGSLPYGHETGRVEWQLQKDADGNALLDDNGEAIYVGFPELTCDKGHRWYKGEGPRRNINGKNPILFESHIKNRKRREIYPTDGVPDPAFTMDRWGKRPIVAMYNRVHPSGRKTNTKEQRQRGSGFYR